MSVPDIEEILELIDREEAVEAEEKEKSNITYTLYEQGD
jgi:hypothetical protein